MHRIIAPAEIYPRRQWPLWAILLLAVVWLASSVWRIVPGTGPQASAELLASGVPPLMVTLFVMALLRGMRHRTEVAAVEERLIRASDGAAALDQRLQSIERTLTACAERSQLLATIASNDGLGLAGSAERLTAAAREVAEAGGAAFATTSRLTDAMPDLTRLSQQIDAIGGRLSTNTVRQLELIEALLTSVRTRGDEVSAQADGAITSMNTQLAEIDEESRQMTTRIAKRAYALDTAVDGASARATGLLDAISATIAERVATMDGQLAATRRELEAVGADSVGIVGERLGQLRQTGETIVALLGESNARSVELRSGIDTQLEALPSRLAHARDEGAATFDQLSARIAQLQDGLQRLEAPVVWTEAALGALDRQVGQLQATTDRFTASVAAALPDATERVGRLDQETTLLELRIAELRGTLAAGDDATQAIANQVAALRIEVATLGEADLRLVDDRMNATAVVLGDIGGRIAAYGVLSGETRRLVEADVEALDQKFGVLHEAGGRRLDALADHIDRVAGTAETLTPPLVRAQRQIDDLEEQIGTVSEGAAALTGRLDGQLTATSGAFDQLQARGAALVVSTAELHAATTDGTAAVDLITTLFADERASVTAAVTTLDGEFSNLRNGLVALDTATRQVVDGSAAALGATFQRARELAEANAAGLRDLLAAVVTEAEHTLSERGAATAASTFAAPIRRELDAISDTADRAMTTAHEAARVVAQRASGLGTAVDGLASKIAELETQLEVRSRETLTSRSSRLIEMLGAASVDVVALLSVDVGEQAWLHYLKGDRSLFARRTIKQMDGATAAKIARHYAHDPAFTAEASHYLEIFERLSRRLLADPDGEALLATVVSSDLGKLYVVLARATGRWSPMG